MGGGGGVGDWRGKGLRGWGGEGMRGWGGEGVGSFGSPSRSRTSSGQSVCVERVPSRRNRFEREEDVLGFSLGVQETVSRQLKWICPSEESLRLNPTRDGTVTETDLPCGNFTVMTLCATVELLGTYCGRKVSLCQLSSTPKTKQNKRGRWIFW